MPCSSLLNIFHNHITEEGNFQGHYHEDLNFNLLSNLKAYD